MSTDRELLALAAKAYADPDIREGTHGFERLIGKNVVLGDFFITWDPLNVDGDALRLLVKLDLLLMPYPLDKAVRVTRLDQPDTIVSWGIPPDPGAATRRAIVLAGAGIGRRMP